MGERVPVLVAGGSLVGLSTALFLADRGVPVVVVERHSGTAIHPRARGYTARTMEVFRSVGLEDDVRGAGAVGAESGALIRARTLADEHFDELARPEVATPPGISPCPMFACDQDRLEPLLLRRARELGAEVRFGAELVGFCQTGEEIVATVRDRKSGEESLILADYLVAADGAHSEIRDALGIDVDQIGRFGHAVSILFTADLEEVARGRHFFACIVDAVEAGILVRRDDRRWQLVAAFHPERGERVEDFDEARCRELVGLATGVPSIEIQLADVLPWEVTAQVAERFGEGRVFLAGDAAHTATPWGGLGANTGIQDAHNLAWKLAAVLDGAADPCLLDTYQSERHPVGEMTVGFAMSLMRREPGALERYASVTLGYRYLDGAVVEEDASAHGEHTSDLIEDPLRPSGRPGTRAPHVPLTRDGDELSTLDLLGDGFAVLTGHDGEAWVDAAGEVAARARFRLAAHRIAKDGPEGLVDAEGRWTEAYGVQADGAVLVRPDGFIAWRAAGAVADPAEALDRALAAVLRRAPAVR